MITWQYIAGFFDGEGTLGWNSAQDTFQLQVNIAQNEANNRCKVLEAIQRFLNREGIPSNLYPVSQKKKGFSQVPILILQINGGREGKAKFLSRCLPYLWVKKVHVQDTLRTLQLFSMRKDNSFHVCGHRKFRTKLGALAVCRECKALYYRTKKELT